MSWRLIKIDEKEVSAVDCSYCDQPFDIGWQNDAEAIEIEGGEHYLHKSCAKKLAERLIKLSQ